MTAFDRMLGQRASGYGVLGAALALALMRLTEEPLTTWPQRLARLCMFAPAIAAVAAALTLAQARAGGELRALAALGASPLRAARGPSVFAWGVGLAAVALVASPWVDVGALFPAVHPSAHWTPDAHGFRELHQGVSIDRAGALSFLPAGRAPALSARPHGLAAALAVGPLALVLPVWVAWPISPGVRAAGVLTAAALLLVLLHMVAAGQLQSPWLMAVALPLSLPIVASYYGRRA